MPVTEANKNPDDLKHGSENRVNKEIRRGKLADLNGFYRSQKEANATVLNLRTPISKNARLNVYQTSSNPGSEIEDESDDEDRQIDQQDSNRIKRNHKLEIARSPTGNKYRDYLSLYSKVSAKEYQSMNRMTKIPKLINEYLKPNAKYIGQQQSGSHKYHIEVEFKTIDLIDSLVTGFLQIKGLTDDHPVITTCFKGEIINNPLNRYEWGNESMNKYSKDVIKKYSFITENDKWGSFIENDLIHWKKLTENQELNNEELKLKLEKIQNGQEDNQFIYMRWKEEFLLPDSRIKQISGASFEGFYYIVLNIGGGSKDNESNSGNKKFYSSVSPGSISGLYYHIASDKFQSLSLRHIEDHGKSNIFEFT